MTPFFRSVKALLILGVLTISISSCLNKDDYDFDKLSEKVNWTPNMTVPVGYGTYSLKYLLDQHKKDTKDQVIFFRNDDIFIEYRKEDLFSYSVDKVLKFPIAPEISDDITTPAIATPVPYSLLPDNLKKFSQTFALDVATGEDGIQIYNVNLNSKLRVRFNNPINARVKATLTFPKSIISGSTNTEFSHELIINPGQNNSISPITINNVLFKFKEPFSTNNKLEVKLDFEILDNGGTVSNTGGNIQFSLKLDEFKFQMAEGDFGKRSINLVEDGANNEFDLDVDFWDNLNGSFHFANPTISLIGRNYVGVPFEINAQMTGYNNDGKSQDLNAKALRPTSFPSTRTEVENGVPLTITYDKDNSDIAELMSLPPSKKITYAGNIVLNPIDKVNSKTPNIISKNSKIDVDLKVEIPLEFSAESLNFRDTIKDVDIDDPEKIKKGAILITTKNGFPLAAQVDHIYLVDANFKQLNEIVDSKVLSPAPIDGDGNVDPSKLEFVTHRVELSQEQIKSLKNTKHVLVNLKVNTSNNKVVKFKASHKLEFKLAVQAQIDLNN